MEKKKRHFSLFMVVLVMVLVIGINNLPTATASDVINWNMSCWGNRRGATELYHWWADEMEKRSGGRFKVTFNYGGVLAPAKENLDGVKAGLFEMAMMCSHYNPDKVPLHEITNLPFFAPLDVADEVRWEGEIYRYPPLSKWLADKWDSVIIIPQILPRYEIMSTKPIRKAEDFKGIRIHASKDQGRVLQKYGAVITTITGSEIYNAFERGIVDAVSYPWTYAFGSYKLYEPAKYSIIDINLGIRNMPAFANKKKWDALPADIKKIHQDLLKEMPEMAKKLYAKADEKWIPIFKENTEFIYFPEQERAKLLKVAEVSWKEWIKSMEDKGLPGQKVFDYAREKSKK